MPGKVNNENELDLLTAFMVRNEFINLNLKLSQLPKVLINLIFIYLKETIQFYPIIENKKIARLIKPNEIMMQGGDVCMIDYIIDTTPKTRPLNEIYMFEIQLLCTHNISLEDRFLITFLFPFGKRGRLITLFQLLTP